MLQDYSNMHSQQKRLYISLQSVLGYQYCGNLILQRIFNNQNLWLQCAIKTNLKITTKAILQFLPLSQLAIAMQLIFDTFFNHLKSPSQLPASAGFIHFVTGDTLLAINDKLQHTINLTNLTSNFYFQRLLVALPVTNCDLHPFTIKRNF